MPTSDSVPAVVFPDAEGAVVTGPQGPAGAVGPPGPSGQPRWSGEGPPGLIIGASPGDDYIDTLSGTIYRLL